MSRILLCLFWVTLLVVYSLAVMPAADVPRIGNDKLEHMFAFFTLSVLASLALPRLSVVKIALGLAAFGGFIELSQMIPPIHRDASLADWFADAAAILAGLVVTWPIRRTAVNQS